MSNFKGTRGEVSPLQDEYVLINGNIVANLESEFIHPKEIKNNQILIIDAFKVRQQITCELSELLEQNKEMLAMLEEILQQREDGRIYVYKEDMKQLIKKVKDNG